MTGPMPDRIVLVTCLYDLARREPHAHRRTFDQYLELCPAVLSLGFDTVVFTDPDLVADVEAVATECSAPNRVRVLGRDLMSWSAMATVETIQQHLDAGNRLSPMDDADKQSSLSMGLGWSKLSMMQAAAQDSGDIDLLLFVDIGIAHLGPLPNRQLIEQRLRENISDGPRRIRVAGISIPGRANSAKRAPDTDWYRQQTMPCVAGGLLAVPPDRLNTFVESLADEIERSIAAGWSTSVEVILGQVVVNNPQSFEVCPSGSNNLFSRLGEAVAGENLIDAIDALAAIEPDDEPALLKATFGVLQLSSAPEPLEKLVRRLERGEKPVTLAALMPGSRMGVFDVPAPAGWHNTNPSIAADPAGGYRVALRQVSYQITSPHGYHFPKRYKDWYSRNLLLALSDQFEVAWSAELVDETEARSPDVNLAMFEDLRLFRHDNKWRALGTLASPAHSGGRYRIILLTIDDAATITGKVNLTTPDPTRNEKNWVPILGKTSASGDPLLVYKSWPLQIYSYSVNSGMTESVTTGITPLVARYWRGSSQLVPFDDEFITVVHEKLRTEDWSRLMYLHRFARYNNQFELTGVTRPFSFTGQDIEFAAGLTVGESEAIVTFGVFDRTAAVATIPLDELRSSLQPVTTGRS